MSEVLEEFIGEFFPDDLIIGEKLQTYFDNAPDKVASDKLLRFVNRELNPTSINPENISLSDIKKWVHRIVMISELDIVDLEHPGDIKRQLAFSKEVIRLVIWALVEQMKSQDERKTQQILQTFKKETKLAQKSAQPLVLELLNMIGIDQLYQESFGKPKGSGLPKPQYLIWIGPKEIHENLAQILHKEYSAIPRVNSFLKAVPIVKDSFEPCVWKKSVHHLIWLIDLLEKKGWVKAKRNGAKWDATLASFMDNEEKVFEKNLARELQRMKKFQIRYDQEISEIEGIMRSIKRSKIAL